MLSADRQGNCLCGSRADIQLTCNTSHHHSVVSQSLIWKRREETAIIQYCSDGIANSRLQCSIGKGQPRYVIWKDSEHLDRAWDQIQIQTRDAPCRVDKSRSANGGTSISFATSIAWGLKATLSLPSGTAVYEAAISNCLNRAWWILGHLQRMKYAVHGMCPLYWVTCGYLDF